MNEIPSDLLRLIPEKALTVLNFLWIVSFVVSRAWKNWKAGGGWYGIKRAFLSGEKIADAKAIDDAKDAQKMDEKRATQPPFQP